MGVYIGVCVCVRMKSEKKSKLIRNISLLIFIDQVKQDRRQEHTNSLLKHMSQSFEIKRERERLQKIHPRQPTPAGNIDLEWFTHIFNTHNTQQIGKTRIKFFLPFQRENEKKKSKFQFFMDKIYRKISKMNWSSHTIILRSPFLDVYGT